MARPYNTRQNIEKTPKTTRSSTSTLAIEDGADPDVLETRVTHTRKSRNAFDG